MAVVLPAAILCGALWVCSTSLALRINPPPGTTNTHSVPSVIANTPLTTRNTPLVTAKTPSVTTNTSSMVANATPVTAKTPSVTTNTSSMVANTTSVTAKTPSVTINTSSIIANTTSVTVNTLSVTANTPSLTNNTPSVTANIPSVTVKTPSVTANTPPMTNKTLSVTTKTPVLTNNTPPVTFNTPQATANTSTVTNNSPSMTTNTPSVTTNAPSVTASSPSMTVNTPSVTANTPSVTANTLSVTVNTPSMTFNTPLVTIKTPSATTSTPSVIAKTPSMTANTPSVTANMPSVTANTPSMNANTPSVTTNTPSVTANKPSLTNTPLAVDKNPSVTVNTPSVAASMSSVTANTPAINANTPSVTTNTPSVTANKPSVTNTPLAVDKNPSVTVNTPSVTASMPSVTANTPAINANTPSVTTNTPSVTANKPSVTNTPMAVDKNPSVTVNTPSVTASMSSVTANTPAINANTPSVTANTPSATANNPSVTTNTPLPGRRVHLEDDRVVFSVDAEYLAACARSGRGKPYGGGILYTLIDSINNQSSADFRRGTLRIDFDLDNATLAAQSRDAGTKKHCRFEIRTSRRPGRYDGCIDGARKASRWIKILHFQTSPDGDLRFSLLTHSYVYFRDSLERASLLSDNDTFRDMYFKLDWTRLPRVVSAELKYTLFDCRKDLLLNVTMTSPLTGVLRTPFWDGSSVYTAGFEFTGHGPNTNGTVITVPNGHHAMISWEHMGMGEASNCDSFKVHVGDQRKVFATYCGTSSPSPVLTAWGQIVVVVETPEFARLLTQYVQPSRVVFTGISMRFSFHNDSALPQQLADKTWNCSVAHWADFQQHLQCDLLSECAGGEDEADCPYARGTCHYGYLAAGGSCFTFGPTPEALTSWTEAEAACKSRGARLPTLNTPGKSRAVLDLLSHRGWESIYIGLSFSNPSLPELYRQFLQWSDSSVAYYTNDVFLAASVCRPCAFLKKSKRSDSLYMDSCFQKVIGNLLCEVQGPSNLSVIDFTTDNKPSRINSTRCPKGHVTQNFMSCDPRSDCLANCYTPFYETLTSLPPAFKCSNDFERVPFTLVCDHREDCSDASDEICVFPPCLEFECDNKQCIARHKTYDGVKDCLDGSDETVRSKKTLQGRSLIPNSKPPPAMVVHDGRGFYDLLDIAEPSAQGKGFYDLLDIAEPSAQGKGFYDLLDIAEPSAQGKGFYDLLDIADPSAQSTSSDVRTAEGGCPDSHFQCPGVNYYCLPVYVRCNGVHDCPEHQDEADCENFQCPGFYRCLGSKVCLHDDHLCDGISQCPARDDELLCGFVCPVGCTCYGLAFFCTVPFDASRHVGLRFLDASGSGMGLKGVSNNTMLFYLSLANCNITQLVTMNLANVFHLDLSENSITTLTEKHMGSYQNLQVFVLAGNPLRRILEDNSLSQGASFAKLHTLDLSGVPITAAQMVNLHVFPNVSNLNLSNTRFDVVSGFSYFRKLRVLDLRGCPVTYFTRSIFQGLDDLSTVYADNYKLCCPVTLPEGFNVLSCHAPFDEVSSCEGLLKSELYRVSLSVLTSMILLGNAGSFVYRVFISREKKQSSFSLFVTNLCASDFLMGLYSAIIGVADRLYLGNYVWNDVTWRRSVMCKMAGVLSLVSSEVSVLIICLITVDRFLVTRFPFSRQLHFSLRSARVACVTVWGFGVLLAVTPLLPVTSHWQLYSQTGICIPLPVTRAWFAGKQYSFGILIILNFVLFLVIAGGQMSIYLSIRANSMTTSDTTQKAKDLTIARRLVTVAVSDFLCWFPVGLLGILSSRGQPIPGEVSVVIAVFVLPLNSALNPFLYTGNVILERRQRAREQRLLETILSRHCNAIAEGEGERSIGPDSFRSTSSPFGPC